MKKWIALSVLALVMCFSAVAEAGPMRDALNASKRGDYTTAYRLWLPLAEDGNKTAQYNIGLLYAKGRGRARNSRRAARWYGKAAAQGHASAQVNLGTLHIRGRGVARDYDRARRLFASAAKRGSLSAQHNLALVYYNGWGVDKSYSQAVNWFRKAARLGDAKSQYQLGFLYTKGRGVPQSYRQAMVWHRRAANQGISRSISAIGAMYLAGWGVERNHKLAYTWLTIATNRGFKGAQKALDIAARRMSDNELDRAERDARRWRPKSKARLITVQRLLIRAGFNVGVVDGLPNSRTRAAIRRYQKNNNLEPDGRVSLALLRRLTRAAIRNSPVVAGRTPSTNAPDAGARTRPRRQARRDNGTRPGNDPRQRRGRPAGGKPGVDVQPDRARPGTSRIGANPRRQQREPRRRTGKRSTGTGFFITKAGHILTNRHVVNRCVKLSIRWSDGETGNAKILKISKTADLALLKTDAKVISIAKFRTGTRLRQGEDILVYGFPLSGLLSSSGNLTAGSVTALAGLRDDAGTMQISAPVQPGNSGGPVLDKLGRIVGVVVAKLNAARIARITKDIPQNINFAIKASIATNFLEAQAISYAVDNGGTQKSNADNAEAAKAFTVQIKCTR